MAARLVIRPLRPGEAPPWRLLLDADPSRSEISTYLKLGRCYVAARDGAIVGVRRDYFARPPYRSIRENGIPLRDMVRLSMPSRSDGSAPGHGR